MGASRVTNLAVATYRKDFTFISFSLLVPDLKAYLTTRSYYRQLFKNAEEKQGVRI
jgi:hypothetical protein